MGKFPYLQKWLLVVQLTHSKRTAAKWITLVKYLTLKIHFSEMVIRSHGKLLPILLKYPVKIFFSDITGVEKNPWTTMKTDERLHLETSALENSLRNGNQVVTLSTQLIKSNFLIKPPPPTPPQHHSFLKNLLVLFEKANNQTHPHTHTHTHKNKWTQN